MVDRKTRYISIRASARDIEIIEALCEAWQENVTQVIKRTLEQAYTLEFIEPHDPLP